MILLTPLIEIHSAHRTIIAPVVDFDPPNFRGRIKNPNPPRFSFHFGWERPFASPYIRTTGIFFPSVMLRNMYNSLAISIPAQEDFAKGHGCRVSMTAWRRSDNLLSLGRLTVGSVHSPAGFSSFQIALL
jgi:hypothetical protein